MAKKQKLKAKLLDAKHDKNWLLAQLGTLLRQLGFSERQGKGSHDQIFYKEGVEELINLQPTEGGKAKPYQVKQVREIVIAYHL
jgi:hypothetical protein